MMYKSQFQKIDPYDCFCGPGSHMWIGTYSHEQAELLYLNVCVCVL